MAVVALVTDLMFDSKITATAVHVGVGVESVRTADALRDRAEDATGIALDLSVPGVDGVALIRELKAARPMLAIVAFLPHVEAELAAAAREAGADRVLARSAFTKQLGEILTQLAGGTA